MFSRDSVEELAGIEDSVWVEGVFECVVDVKGYLAEGVADPAFFCEADAMFTGDGAAML